MAGDSSDNENDKDFNINHISTTENCHPKNQISEIDDPNYEHCEKLYYVVNHICRKQDKIEEMFIKHKYFQKLRINALEISKLKKILIIQNQNKHMLGKYFYIVLVS